MQRRTFLATPAAALAQRKPRRKILLRTGWQMRNIGDVCFTPAMLAAIQRFIPEADVTCWAANIDQPGRAMIRRDLPNAIFGEWAFHLATATPGEMAAALLAVHRDYDAARRKREPVMRTVERLTAAGFAVIRSALGLAWEPGFASRSLGCCRALGLPCSPKTRQAPI